ncbi:MAG TPA: FHA domain-containing protein [Chloroflexi bacterium]|nr:MAG: hypothetical protein B6243_03895 [Anaerolineaceae bacterium 4572_5.2]HEY85088.1 FHA domain-containing protein [Chloroflexota bacterium]
MTTETPTPQEMDKDHLVIRHPDGSVTKIALPPQVGDTIRLGRELDNDVPLPDPRTSRHHAYIRRTVKDSLEICDVGSANGTIVGSLRLQANEWYPLAPGQVVMMGDTRVLWEQALSSQDTIGMMPIAGPKTTPVAKKSSQKSASWMPWAIGAAILLLLLLAIWGIFALLKPADTSITAATPAAGAPADIAQQTPEGATEGGQPVLPTETPTPKRPMAPAVPFVSLEDLRFLPVISGALFDTEHVYMIGTVRIENLGDEPFTVSTHQFTLQTDTGEVLKELGRELAPSEFKRMGVTDRFNNLALRSGGSVSEELIFYLETKAYNLTLSFTPDGFEPLVMETGTVYAGEQLAQLLGTPVAEGTMVASASPAISDTTPTAAAVSAVPSDGYLRSIPDSSLVGTIAYADFNGATYDLFFGNVATGDSIFWRGETSQPAFSNSGERIACHSWANNSRGLITSNMDHSNGFLVGTFIEDQLPTWSPDDGQILFLSRRTGTRQSQFYLAPSNIERPEAQFIMEGEYPTWHASNNVVFKGWGNSGEGLKMAPDGSNLSDFNPLTEHIGDTAPSISPDGKKVAFMSNRNNNWDIYIINIDGSNLQRLTTDDAQDGLPTWSPDGKAIAFVSNRGGPWSVWAMTSNGTGIEQLFTYQGSPDGFVASEPTHDSTRGWAEERISWSAKTY